jgi:hypothetical protein
VLIVNKTCGKYGFLWACAHVALCLIEVSGTVLDSDFWKRFWKGVQILYLFTYCFAENGISGPDLRAPDRYWNLFCQVGYNNAHVGSGSQEKRRGINDRHLLPSLFVGIKFEHM